jgi:hypothetical protein
MVYNGKSYWNWWFRGTPILGNLHIGSLKPTFPLWNCMFQCLRALGSLPSPNLRFCVGAMMGLASKINLKITAVVHGPWSQHASNMADQWEFHMPDITKHYKTLHNNVMSFDQFLRFCPGLLLRHPAQMELQNVITHWWAINQVQDCFSKAVLTTSCRLGTPFENEPWCYET